MPDEPSKRKERKKLFGATPVRITTHDITALSITAIIMMTLRLTTLGIAALIITALIMMTLDIKIIDITILSITAP